MILNHLFTFKKNPKKTLYQWKDALNKYSEFGKCSIWCVRVEKML